MTTQEDLKFDRSLLGVEHAAGTFHITKELILAYAGIIGETNPIYVDEEEAIKSEYGGLIASPTLCNLFTSPMDHPDINLEAAGAGFHAGQALESIETVRPGDTLEAMTKLKEVYAKTGRSGTMVFVVWETTFVNQDQVKVAAVQESFVRRLKEQE